MTEDSCEQEKPVRKVAKTLLEADSPDLKKIRQLLRAEPQPASKVAHTLLDAPLPPQPVRRVARTMVDTRLPIVEEAQTSTGNQTKPEPAISASPSGEKEQQRFVAKTRLDHSVLAETLLKFEVRKEQRAIEEAKERADQPIKEIHPVDSKKLTQKCPWTWDEDDSKDKFRYCSKCKSTVYNFDGLELPDAEALIFTRENKKNSTLYKRPDGKFMTEDCPVQVKRKRRLIMVSVVVAMLIFASVTIIASMPTPQPQPVAVDVNTEVIDIDPDTSSAEKSQNSFADQKSQSVAPGTATGAVKRKRPTFGPEDKHAYWN